MSKIYIPGPPGGLLSSSNKNNRFPVNNRTQGLSEYIRVKEPMK